MQTEPTVFVVDDDRDMREALDWAIRDVGYRVITYASPRDCLQDFDASRPGCLVLDLRLPEMNGLELYHALRARGSRHPFIVITGHGDIPAAVDALQAGALDFIEKPLDFPRFLQRIETAVKQDAEARRAAAEFDELRQRLATLTDRERDVLKLIIGGKLSKGIAHELFISPKTVEVIRFRIREKLGVKSNAELLRLLLRYPTAEDLLGKTL
jgi:two-component system, LuxR family, response regulator FixJ